MVEVKEATYVVEADGGEIHAVMTVGNHEVRSALPIGDEDAFLRSLLDDLAVRIEKITYLPGPGTREVQITMTMGGRTYISHLPLNEQEDMLAPSIDRLLQAVGARFMRTMESSLRRGDGVESKTGDFSGNEPA